MMQDAQTIGGMTMILGTIAGLVMAYAGLRFDTWFVPAKVFASWSATGYLAVLFLSDETALATSSSTIRAVVLEQLVPIALAGAGAGILLAAVLLRWNRPLATNLSQFLFWTILGFLAWGHLDMELIHVVAIAVGGCAAVLLRILQPARWAMGETAILGSVLTSWLFQRFYYLPTWLFLAFAVLLGGTGYLVQNNRYRKTTQNGQTAKQEDVQL